MTYNVRVYCEEDAQYYRTTQTTLDETWITTVHEVHTIKDFVKEKEV